MASDRLGQIQEMQAVREQEDNKAGASGAGGQSQFMTDFFAEVGQVKKSMSEIRRNIKLIETSHAQCLGAISVEQGQKYNQELEATMQATNAAASQVRNKLKEMDAQNKEYAKDPKNKGQPEARVRSNMHGTLTRKFVDLMNEYQEVQSKYKAKYKEKIERQTRIVKPDVTQKELDEAIENGGDSPIFAQQILPSQKAAQDALADIQEKHKDIQKLERSIQELNQLFKDMAVLVEAQSDLLDQIEYTVSQSVNYTKKGVDELKTAVKYQKRYRKKMCCVIMILLVIAMIFLSSYLLSAAEDV